MSQYHASFFSSPDSSSQATYRLRRAFSFYYKAHRALILLLLASKPNPLHWASVWGRRFAAVLSDLEKISILTVPSKTKGHPKGCPFILDSGRRRLPPPRFSPAVKTLVRHTRAASGGGDEYGAPGKVKDSPDREVKGSQLST